MSSTEPAGHLAIGEVLTLLREDFPDVTISKIRFLESQGLIQPERTPSGYRKFFDGDIERLRWVLRQQKERFLPLKVIKQRLDSGEPLSDAPEATAQPTLFGPAEGGSTGPPVPAVSTTGAALDVTPEANAATNGPAASRDEGGTGSAGGGVASGPSPEATDSAPATDPAAWLAALQEAPRRRPPTRPVEPVIVFGDEDDHTRYGLGELAAAAGLTADQVAQLVDFGIVRKLVMGGVECFDDAALDAARVAAGFLSRGIEARHLRAYKLAAEREVAMFEQLILPLLRQRNPAAREQATTQLSELTELGGELRRALLRQALRTSLQRP